MTNVNSCTVTLSDGNQVDEQAQTLIGRLLLYGYEKSILENKIDEITKREDDNESYKNHILMNRRVALAEVEAQYYCCASGLWELAITNPGLGKFLKELGS